MHHTLEFLLHHGYLVLFGWVLAEQLGVPAPSVPMLLAMGALIGAGSYSFPIALALTMTAALAADTAWYLLGRRRGNSILRLLCRISLEPDSCVSSTQYWFRKLGGWALVVAKFFPGLSTVSPPMAGLSKMPMWKFLLADGAGGLLWGSVTMGVGYVFREQLEDIGILAMRLGGWLVAVVSGIAALWIGFKYWQRRRFMNSLRVARITPEEVLARLDEVVILDLRTPAEVEWDGMKIAQARWFDRKELEERHAEIPRDRDVVLYCTCPSEATSARAALQLNRLGIMRVRPLAGGYVAWRDLGYPVEPATDVILREQTI